MTPSTPTPVDLEKQGLMAHDTPDQSEARSPESAAPSAAWRYCTCKSGRDLDGSEFGPCAYCEYVGYVDAQYKALLADAERWRFTQKSGFGIRANYEVDEIEDNVFSVYLGNIWVGVGHNRESAVDCAIMLTAEFGNDVPPEAVLGVFRQHYKRKWDGTSWKLPPTPDFRTAITAATGEA